MPEPRLSPLEEPYPNGVATTLARMMPPGVEPIGLFRTIAHSPRMLEKLVASSMLDKVSLTLRQREILILRTTALCNAEYEWGVHIAFFADRVGFSSSEISAISFGVPSDRQLSDDDSLLLQLVDDYVQTKTISANTWPNLSRSFNEEQIIEMTMLIGMYHSISFLCNGLGVANEKGTPIFEDYRPS